MKLVAKFLYSAMLVAAICPSGCASLENSTKLKGYLDTADCPQIDCEPCGCGKGPFDLPMSEEDKRLIADSKEIMLKDGHHPEDYEYSVKHSKDLAIVSYWIDKGVYGGAGRLTFKRESEKYVLVDKEYGQ